jgi:RNA 2',3'-cyclic 3'-phosphodiesterase
MRMFAAVVPPEEVIDDLARFLEPRRVAGPQLRWTDAEQWHVTLAFMAQVSDNRVERVMERVAEAVGGRAPISLQCAGGGAFPDAAAARVIWAGMSGARAELDALKALARGVRRACSHAGAAPSGGPFHPHLTLARSGRPIEATRWLRVLEGYAGPTWIANEVTLITSHLGEGPRGRPRYERLALLELAGPARWPAVRAPEVTN